MAYVIRDRQFEYRYFADGVKFKTHEEIRQQLISYHSIDMDKADLKILQKMSLKELLEFGEWEIEKAPKRLPSKAFSLCLG